MISLRQFITGAGALLAASSFAQDAVTNSYVHEQSDANGYVWPTGQAVLKALDNWQDQKYGVLFHWGLYSLPGICESWPLCDEDWITRPNDCNYEGYKKWYWGLAEALNPSEFNPEQWADIMKKGGMKYMVFTTKHHDGFCTFDSKLTDFTIAKGPFSYSPRKNVAKEVFNAFRDKDFMIGCYFSKPDWHTQWFWNDAYATKGRHINYSKERHPDWWKNYQDYTAGQLGELLGGEYGRFDILWLDYRRRYQPRQHPRERARRTPPRSHLRGPCHKRPQRELSDSRTRNSRHSAELSLGKLHSPHRCVGKGTQSASHVAQQSCGHAC